METATEFNFDVVECKRQEVEYMIQEAECMMQEAECKKREAECKKREIELLYGPTKASAQPEGVVEKLPQRATPKMPSSVQPKFKLACFLKGKFALIIWAACKLHAFVRTDGGEMSMRDVANELGAPLGIHFTEKEWKSTLEGNFNVKVMPRIFRNLEREVERRFEGRKE